MKIRIGVPMFTQHDMHPECGEALDSLKSDSVAIFEILHGEGASSMFLRNKLAAKGCKQIKQKLDCDYFLSVDSDVSFTRDNIMRLIEAFEQRPDAGIVSSAYVNNGPNSQNIVAFKAGAFIPMYSSGVIPVDWVGAGFAMYSRGLLEALDYPWFRCPVVTTGEMAELVTEDIGICMAAKAAGFTVYVDCDNHVGHCYRG